LIILELFQYNHFFLYKNWKTGFPAHKLCAKKQIETYTYNMCQKTKFHGTYIMCQKTIFSDT
jgi:hypothetical protein